MRPTIGMTGCRRSASFTVASSSSSFAIRAGSPPAPAISSRSRALERRIRQQPAQRPRERRGRRLVAGDQQRDQLVVHLVLAQRPALVVARVEHHREHVGAPRRPLRAAAADLRAQDGARAPRVAAGTAPTGSEARGRCWSHVNEEGRVRARIEHPAERVRELREARTLGDAEDRAQDDLERDRLHRTRARRTPRRGASRRSSRPPCRSSSARRRCIRSPWNAGKHHLSLPEVLGAVEQQQRVLPEERLEHEVRLPGVTLVRPEARRRP